MPRLQSERSSYIASYRFSHLVFFIYFYFILTKMYVYGVFVRVTNLLIKILNTSKSAP